METATRRLNKRNGGGTRKEEIELAALAAKEEKLERGLSWLDEIAQSLPFFEPDKESKPMSWDHLAQIGFLGALLGFCQFGGLKVFANLLLESGLFTRVETVEEAMWLGLSVPLASCLLKYADFPMGEKARRLYYQTLVGIAVVCSLVWAGSSAWMLMPQEVELDLMSETPAQDDSGWRRALVSSCQLLLDVTASAALFQWMMKICEQYRPARKSRKRKSVEKAQRKSQKRLVKIKMKKAKLEGRIERKKANEDVAVNAAEAERSIIEYALRGGGSAAVAALVCLGAAFSGPRAKAAELVVMLDSVPIEQSKSVATLISRLYLDLSPSDSMTVFDGSARQLSTFQLPDSRAYANERVKARFNEGRATLAAAGRHLEEFRGRLGSLDLPRLAKTLGETAPGRKQAVLLIGNSQLRDKGTFSMAPGNLRPSDSHILSSPEESLFGTKGRDWLEGRRVHWLATDKWDSDTVRDQTRRVWGHYIAELGGELVTMTDSPSLIGPRVLDSTIAGVADWSPLDPKEPLAMLRIQDRESAVELFEVPEQSPAPVAVEPPAAGRIRVGVKWSKDCDVDLWILRGGLWCSFAKPQPEEGVRYFKDLRRGGNGLEMIEYDLASLEELEECYLNLWSGTGPVTGEVVLMIDQTRYMGQFTIPASSGNRGVDMPDRAGSPFWTKLDLQHLTR